MKKIIFLAVLVVATSVLFAPAEVFAVALADGAPSRAYGLPVRRRQGQAADEGEARDGGSDDHVPGLHSETPVSLWLRVDCRSFSSTR